VRKSIAAIVLVSKCRCLRCDHRWRESSLLFRNDDSSHSYDQTTERADAILRGEMPICGRRFSSRSLAACHNCVTGPNITVWEGRLTFEFDEPVATPSRATTKRRRGPPDPSAQAKINAIFDEL
jgi:hypothetical protein